MELYRNRAFIDNNYCNSTVHTNFPCMERPSYFWHSKSEIQRHEVKRQTARTTMKWNKRKAGEETGFVKETRSEEKGEAEVAEFSFLTEQRVFHARIL